MVKKSLLVITCFFIYSFCCYSETFIVDGIKYAITNYNNKYLSKEWVIPDGEAYVITLLTNSSNVIIPETVNFNNKSYNVTRICKGASQEGSLYFYGKKIGSIVLPNTLSVIEDFAFSGCQNLETITISSSVTEIGFSCFPKADSSFTSGFESVRLKNIIVDPGNAIFESIDGVLFNRQNKSLLFYPSNRQEDTYTIPSGTTSIGSYAFMSVRCIQNLILPDSLLAIDADAITNCSMKTIYIPASVKTIGSGNQLYYYESNGGIIVIVDNESYAKSYAIDKKLHFLIK